MSFDLTWLKALSAAAFAEPAWQTGATAALVAVVCLLAMRRARSRLLGGFLRLAVVLIAVTATLAFFHRSAVHERLAERRALETRNFELIARVLAPGSALACLDGEVGEAVENACEKAVFASPATAAAAVAYMAARLALLADGLGYAGRSDPAFVATLAGLRRTVELDRFGIVAHVLATRDGCTADECPAFVLMRDVSALKANLKARAFDAYVARYAAAWATEPKPPAAEKPAEPAPPPQASAPAPSPPVASRYNFPSAASIPPVSIMNAEPPRPAADNAAAEPAAKTPEQPEKPAAPAVRLPVPPKRSPSQAAAPPAR
jgi:hypothetical protein